MKENTTQLQKKLLEFERKRKKDFLYEILSDNIGNSHFEILGFNLSGKFIEESEVYPNNKYQRNLFQQMELNKKNELQAVLSVFLEQIPNSYVYVLFYNYNYILVKIEKKKLLENWIKFIEIDRDEIKIYNPANGSFLIVELMEDFMKGKEDEGRVKFYELTKSEKKNLEK